MPFANETSLDDVLKHIKQETAKAGRPALPIYIDPIGLQEAERSLNSTVSIEMEGIPLRTSLRLALKQLGMGYKVEDGVLIITSEESIDEEQAEAEHERRLDILVASGGWRWAWAAWAAWACMGGMGGMGGAAAAGEFPRNAEMQAEQDKGETSQAEGKVGASPRRRRRRGRVRRPGPASRGVRRDRLLEPRRGDGLRWQGAGDGSAPRRRWPSIA